MGQHHPKEAPVKLLAPRTSTISLAILSAVAVALAAGCGGGGTQQVERTVTVQQKAAVARTVAVQHKAAALSATGDQRLYGQDPRPRGHGARVRPAVPPVGLQLRLSSSRRETASKGGFAPCLESVSSGASWSSRALHHSRS
jgi:hypothetical protein